MLARTQAACSPGRGYALTRRAREQRGCSVLPRTAGILSRELAPLCGEQPRQQLPALPTLCSGLCLAASPALPTFAAPSPVLRLGTDPGLPCPGLQPGEAEQKAQAGSAGRRPAGTDRLAEGQEDLAPEDVEEVGWSGAVHDDPVAVVQLAHVKVVQFLPRQAQFRGFPETRVPLSPSAPAVGKAGGTQPLPLLSPPFCSVPLPPQHTEPAAPGQAASLCPGAARNSLPTVSQHFWGRSRHRGSVAASLGTGCSPSAKRSQLQRREPRPKRLPEPPRGAAPSPEC